MAAGKTLTQIVQLRVADDGTPKSAFLRAVENMVAPAKQRVDKFSAETKRELNAALSPPIPGQYAAGVRAELAGAAREVAKYTAAAERNLQSALRGGGVDLDVGSLRAAAAAQQQRAVAARELAQATALASQEQRDFSQSAGLAIAAATELAEREERAALAARRQADATEALQTVLTRQAGAARRASAANDNLAVSAGQHRAAVQQLGFQLGDVAQGLALGVNPAIIFGQQLGQVTQAASLLGGTGALGAVARFLGGPWGIALSVGAVALSPLIGRLFDTKTAADDAKFATSGFGDAQGILGGIIDLTTGKVKGQAEAFKALARAQALAGEIGARSREAEARKQVKDLTEPKFEISGGLGGGFSIERRRQIEGQTASQVLNGVIGGEAAIKQLDRLRRDGRITEEVFLKAAQAIANLGVERENVKMFEQLEKALDGSTTALAGFLREADKAGKRSAGTLSAFGNPLPGGRLTGKFNEPRPGHRHAGLDLAAPTGTPVRAPQIGVVEAVGFSATLGKYIVLTHGAGTTTRYGHLSRVDVAKGDAVGKGDVIGGVGSTGRSTGPHLHYEVLVNGKPVDPTKGKFPVDDVKIAETADRAAAKLREFGESSSAAIAQITAEFDAQPRAIDRAAAATRELEARIADLSKANQGGRFDEQIKAAKATLAIIPESLGRPFREGLETGERQLQVQQLLVSGRRDEADALEIQIGLMNQLGAKTEEELAAALAKAKITAGDLAQRRAQIALARQLSREESQNAARQQAQLAQVAGVRSNLTQTLLDVRSDGAGALGGFAKRLQDQFDSFFADSLIEGLFGEAFQSAEDKIINAKSVETDASIAAARSLIAVADAAAVAAGAIGGTTPGADTPTDAILSKLDAIVVKADYSDPRRLFRMILEKVAGTFLDPETAKKIGEGFGNALEGAAIGQMAGGLILGGSGSRTGSAIGGALGEVAGEKIGKKLGGLLGDFGGPLGGILGGVVGGALGGAFRKTKVGVSTIGVGANGELQIASTTGNSGKRREASIGAATEALTTIERIAEALGATVDASRGLVSIGVRDGKYRVDTSGRGATKLKKGAVDFGEDSAAAVKFATLDLIKDGVLSGLRAGTQALLQNSKDLEAGLQRALDFESVFSRLREHTDPVGAAVDGLDREFRRLQRIFTDAGASTAEYADLERLYGLERAKAVKDGLERAVGPIKSLLDDLSIGDNGLSLRDRRTAARAAFDPLAARVAAGDTTASEDYATAARALLEIERQISGSQAPYFQLLNAVTGASQTAVDAQLAIANASIGRDSPFGKSSVPVNDNAAVVSAIDHQTRAIVGALTSHLDAVNTNLGTLIKLSAAPSTRASSMPDMQFAANW